MTHVHDIAPPQDSVLARVAADEHVFADAYRCDAGRPVALPALIDAFYRTPLFRVERAFLRLFARVNTTDEQVAQLADGRADRFAVWRVVHRHPKREIYLRDRSGRTASWLAVDETGGLYFGSAVYPVTSRNGKRRMGILFWALLGFHRWYSRALLRAASRRLSAPGQGRAL